MKKLLAIILLAISSQAYAIAVPPELQGKTISIVVPYGPGGNSDIMARMLALKVTEQTGVKTVIINKPGAGGVIGSEFVASSKPDGLTLCQCETGPAFMNQIMGEAGAPVKGALVPLSINLEGVLTIAVRGDAPYNDLKGMMLYLDNLKGSGYSSTTGLATLWAEAALDLGKVKSKPVAIVYKSQAEAITAVLSGVTTFVVAGTGDVVKLAEAGKLKILAVGSAKRLPILPNIPTIAESYPELTMTNINGIYGPVGLDSNVKEFINEAWANATWSADSIQTFHNKGLIPIGGDLKRAQAIYEVNYKAREVLFKKYGKLLSK
jgi:tripartite-type tricarboxylate transporter receptor subunit TctC